MTDQADAARAGAPVRTAWFHCFAGTAGDMTMAALVHAGADPMAVAEIVARLPITDYALSFEPVLRCGIAATQAHVVVHHDHHDHHDHHGEHRPYRVIRDLIVAADLPERVATRALASGYLRSTFSTIKSFRASNVC